MISRPYMFLLFTMLSFFNPITLIWFHSSVTFIVVVPCTLLVWFAAKWHEVVKIQEKGNQQEILLGIAIYSINIARNVLVTTWVFHGKLGFGLIDMLFSFISVCVVFYGLRGLKHFVLPVAYNIVLIVGYQLEYTISEIALLQNFLAGLMGSMLQLLGIGASVSGDTVTVYGTQGAFPLKIDVDCTGLKGILAYGSLAVLMIIDVKASYRRKALATAIGFVGTFILNIFRLFTIFLTCYFFGIEAALAVHSYIGYGIFIVWVLVFWAIAFKYLLAPTEKRTAA